MFADTQPLGPLNDFGEGGLIRKIWLAGFRCGALILRLDQPRQGAIHGTGPSSPKCETVLGPGIPHPEANLAPFPSEAQRKPSMYCVLEGGQDLICH